MHNPKKMAIACSIIGAIVVAFLNTTASAVPAALQTTAINVLVPAANLLVEIVMPVIFWLAAMDAGRRSGFGQPCLVVVHNLLWAMLFQALCLGS